jgi:hypothetical protein
MKCPNCGTDNRPGARFCMQCAGPLTGFAAPGGTASGQGFPAVSLMAQSGPQAGQAFGLHDGVNSVGRDPGNDVYLTENSVSRSHAQIGVVPEGVWIKDLGSTSGTLVNGQRVTGTTWLQSGDVVQLGGVVTLGVRVGPAMAPATPAPPPAPGVPIAATPPPVAQPQGGMQFCPRCGTQNWPGVRFCQQCGSPLAAGAPAAPARRSRRMRRAILAGGLMAVSALVLLLLVGALFAWPLLSGGLRLPNVGDWSTMTEEGATAIGVSVVEQRYPELADVAPTVTEVEAQGHRIYNVRFSTSDGTERGFAHTVLVAVDTDDRTISVFESN